MNEEYDSRCPACGDPMDYCQGHGESGDPQGFHILEMHDIGEHADCHEDGCEAVREHVRHDDGVSEPPIDCTLCWATDGQGRTLKRLEIEREA